MQDYSGEAKVWRELLLSFYLAHVLIRTIAATLL
jgi:hypothetical protein